MVPLVEAAQAMLWRASSVSGVEEVFELFQVLWSTNRVGVRREGFSKVFQQPLGSKAASENLRQGISLASALTPTATTEARSPCTRLQVRQGSLQGRVTNPL